MIIALAVPTCNVHVSSGSPCSTNFYLPLPPFLACMTVLALESPFLNRSYPYSSFFGVNFIAVIVLSSSSPLIRPSIDVDFQIKRSNTFYSAIER